MMPLLAASAFHAGSATHLVTLAVCALVIAAVAGLAVRLRARRPAAERGLRLAWVLAVIALQLFSQTWQNWPGNFHVHHTLPLHVCDLVIVPLPFALLGRWRFPRTLLYFWGLGLSLFAFLLPVLREGPDHLAFWLFWIGHLQILGSAVYMVAIGLYRPRPRDVAIAFGTTCLYVALILPVDIALGVDYGAVGPGESAAAILGPWPGRVVLMVVLEGLLFLLLWAPWSSGPRTGTGPGERE
jgi:hypothetical integral membrane protein (TIGR02206 family)